MRKVLGKCGFQTGRSLDPQVVHLTLALASPGGTASGG
jgi:hypothetical protein